MALILRLRSKGKHELQNSSEPHRTYENTRGFDNSGVGEHPNKEPDTSEYEAPEHEPQYGR